MVDFDLTPSDPKNDMLAREATVTTEIRDSGKPDHQTRVRPIAVVDVDVEVL